MKTRQATRTTPGGNVLRRWYVEIPIHDRRYRLALWASTRTAVRAFTLARWGIRPTSIAPAPAIGTVDAVRELTAEGELEAELYQLFERRPGS